MKHHVTTALAVTALVVAVFGSTPIGHAAAQLVLPRESVGTSQLRAGAVTGAKVRNGTLTAAKFKPGQLPAGPQGLRGETGPAGPAGPAGAPGLSGVEVVKSAGLPIAVGEQKGSTATCPAGKRVIGGGASTSTQPLAFRWLGPAGDTTYLATARNVGTQADTLYVWALCATVAG